MKALYFSLRYIVILSTFLFVSTPLVSASELPLAEAKAQGLVGERPDGYLGIVVPSPSAQITALQKDINERRKAEYKRIAESSGATLQSVELLAGQKAIERTATGQFIQNSFGAWVKK